MPVYVYKCDTCGLAFERKQSVTEGPLTDCPECEGRVRRVYQPVGVVFKGSGFYVTDNRSRSATSAPPSSSSSSSSESAKPSSDTSSD
jgi:putative FmdB family regulatory protein